LDCSAIEEEDEEEEEEEEEEEDTGLHVKDVLFLSDLKKN
jgi:hypothetical protein